MNAVVVGGGAWGTAFAHLLRERGHDVTLARPRDAIDDAPYEDSRPRRARRPVALVPRGARRTCAARAPILSLVKGLDPATRRAALDARRDRPVAVLSGPNMAEEVLPACRARP